MGWLIVGCWEARRRALKNKRHGTHVALALHVLVPVLATTRAGGSRACVIAIAVLFAWLHMYTCTRYARSQQRRCSEAK